MDIYKSIDNISIEDLEALVENEVTESKTIEFKEKLPSNSRDDKKEFLADVSSFANASGGFMFYGIREKQGVAIELCGLKNKNADAEILRLENMLRDNIEPRIPGISMRNVSLHSGEILIIIQIPRSWAQPHVVNFGGHWRFYSRNSAGKYPLDITELRTAFNLSEAVAERIRLFRADRVSKIIAGETPVLLSGKARTVLHIVPVNSLDVAADVFDVAQFANDPGPLAPIYAGGWNHRHNFDGFLTYSPNPEGTTASTYLQIFRNGIIEAVDERLLRHNEDKPPYIPSLAFEEALFKALSRYLNIQKRLGVSPPLFVMMSLTGVLNYIMAVKRSRFPFWDEVHPIDRDVLIIPEIMIEDYDCNPVEVMKPAFDAVWNAAGWPQSINYDQEGKWVGQ